MALRWVNQNEFFLPLTKQEWDDLRLELIARGLSDTPETWASVITQLQSTRMPELTKSIHDLINYYKRSQMEVVLKTEKVSYEEQIEAKLIKVDPIV